VKKVKLKHKEKKRAKKKKIQAVTVIYAGKNMTKIRNNSDRLTQVRYGGRGS